jgi:hypothetical protein
MDAYRRLQAENYQMDSPVEICNSTCTERIMAWYILNFHYKSHLGYQACYYFDRGEPFEPIFRAKWENATKRDEVTLTKSIWSHIKCIGAAALADVPGLQIADMLAWGLNREKNQIVGSPVPKEYEHIALAMTRLAPTFAQFWDEGELRNRYRPLIHKAYEKY